MKKYVNLLAVALVLASTTLTGAAAAEWEGFYLGGALGGANHSAYYNDVDYEEFGSTFDVSKNGLLYGAVVGYNFAPGGVVYGIELDLTLSSVENSTRYSNDIDVTDELKGLYSLRGRVGVPAGNALLYGTIGVAMADAEHSWIEDNDPNDSWDSIDNSNFGYVFGLGIEHQFSELISFKVEYSQTEIASEPDENPSGSTMRVAEGVDAIQVGLNFNLK